MLPGGLRGRERRCDLRIACQCLVSYVTTIRSVYVNLDAVISWH